MDNSFTDFENQFKDNYRKYELKESENRHSNMSLMLSFLNSEKESRHG